MPWKAGSDHQRPGLTGPRAGSPKPRSSTSRISFRSIASAIACRRALLLKGGSSTRHWSAVHRAAGFISEIRSAASLRMPGMSFASTSVAMSTSPVRTMVSRTVGSGTTRKITRSR